jgi:hypothetical protein
MLHRKQAIFFTCIFTFGLFIATLFTFCVNRQDQKSRTFNPEPIRNLMLYDRDLVTNYAQLDDIDSKLGQRDSCHIRSLAVTAYGFYWGGEMGGPFNWILCFCRDTGSYFQREFSYLGEYDMSLMNNTKVIESGKNVQLGAQLTQLAEELGPEVYQDSAKMKDLLVGTLEGLLYCQELTDLNKDSIFKSEYTRIIRGKRCMTNLNKIQNEVNSNTSKNICYFKRELNNGFWRGTIRKAGDNKGRYCIDLDYLNGDCAYTLWI